MIYRPNKTMIYGAGAVRVETNPRQRWEFIRKEAKRVLLERDNVMLLLSVDDFNENWERV